MMWMLCRLGEDSISESQWSDAAVGRGVFLIDRAEATYNLPNQLRLSYKNVSSIGKS